MERPAPLHGTAGYAWNIEEPKAELQVKGAGRSIVTRPAGDPMSQRQPKKNKLDGWRKRLARLHEDLSGLEQVDDCFRELFSRLRGSEASFSRGLFAMVWSQWFAIGERRLFKKGSRPGNVSLQGLLEEIRDDPQALLDGADSETIERWTEGRPNPSIIAAKAKADLTNLSADLKTLGDYADTIAHLQGVSDDRSDELRIRIGQLREVRGKLRGVIDSYAEVLTGHLPPDLNGQRFVDGFERELDRMLTAG